MGTAPPPRGMDYPFDLTVPAPIPLFGCPFKSLLGIDIEHVLEPLFRNGRRPIIEGGQRVFFLRLPQDEGPVFSLRTYGVLAFKNIKGQLVIYMPPAWKDGWERKVSFELRGQGREGRYQGSPAVAYVMSLPPGITASIPIPMLGHLGIRTAPEGT